MPNNITSPDDAAEISGIDNQITQMKKEVALLALQELKKEIAKATPDLRKIEILGYTSIQTRN